MEGRLKQKVQGADGILCWRSRHFELDASIRALEVADLNDDYDESINGERGPSSLAVSCSGNEGNPGLPATQIINILAADIQVSLEGARCAVAWRGINAFNGCGFDLIWASGRIWSLLCEDPRSRQLWVDALNACIRSGQHQHEHRGINVVEAGYKSTLMPPPAERGHTRRQRLRTTVPACESSPDHTKTHGPSIADSGRPLSPSARRRDTRGVVESASDTEKISGYDQWSDQPRSGRVQRQTHRRPHPADDGKGGRRSGGLGERLPRAVGEIDHADVASSSSGGDWTMPSPRCERDCDRSDTANARGATDQQRQEERRGQRRTRQGRKRLEQAGPVWPRDNGDPMLSSELDSVSSSSATGMPPTRRGQSPDNGHEVVGTDGVKVKGRHGHVGERISDDRPGSSAYGRVAGGRSGETRQQCDGRERSEQLARASAATWEQFQQLLERSRESKARFDRAMNGAGVNRAQETRKASPAASPASSTMKIDGAAALGSIATIASASALPSKVNRGLLTDRRNDPTGDVNPDERERGKLKSSLKDLTRSQSPVTTAADGRSVHAARSSTDRVSLFTSTASGNSKGIGGNITLADTPGASTPANTGCVNPDLEQSRLSGVTDGEMSVLLDGRHSTTEGREPETQLRHPSSATASSVSTDSRSCSGGSCAGVRDDIAGALAAAPQTTTVKVHQQPHQRLQQRRYPKQLEQSQESDKEEGSSLSGIPRAKPASPTHAASTDDDYADEQQPVRKGNNFAVRVRQLEEELAIARREAAVTSRTTMFLQQQLSAVMATKLASAERHRGADDPSSMLPSRPTEEGAEASATTAGSSEVIAGTLARGSTTLEERQLQPTVFVGEGQGDVVKVKPEDAGAMTVKAAAVTTTAEDQEMDTRAALERERRAALKAMEAVASAKAKAVAAQRRADEAERKATEVTEEVERGQKERAGMVRQRNELERALSAEISERRRVSDALEVCRRSEESLRQRLDATVAGKDLKVPLASARSELEAVSSERDALAKELDQCIGRLGDQAREVASALRSRQQREIADITSRCEVEKEAIREQAALDAEERVKEHTQSALWTQERRLKAEAKADAQRAAKLRQTQVREVKAEAEKAGEATRKDIEKLRGLHSKRVKRLEELLKEESINLADARREIVACKATLASDAGEFQRWTEEQQDQCNKLLRELAKIQKKVAGAAATEAAAREREMLAMDRLKKVVEEARLERAEGLEVRRQLRETLAELESDRSTQARRARTDVQLQRAAMIAQQEVAMLEAERVRWHEERRTMEQALDRLTRLVYGAGSSATTAPIIPFPAEKGGRKNAKSHPWKPAGGGRVPTNGTGYASAACSPIGVNVTRGNAQAFGVNKEIALDERVGRR